MTDENDVFLYVNEALCEHYRYTARQLIGMTRRLLLPINYAEDLRAVRRRLCAGPSSAVMETLCSDGRRQRVSMRLVPVGVRLGAGLDVQTVYMGVCCPVGSEAQRDLAMLTTPWSQLAAMLDSADTSPPPGGSAAGFQFRMHLLDPARPRATPYYAVQPGPAQRGVSAATRD